jgi:hypothetical protein
LVESYEPFFDAIEPKLQGIQRIEDPRLGEPIVPWIRLKDTMKTIPSIVCCALLLALAGCAPQAAVEVGDGLPAAASPSPRLSAEPSPPPSPVSTQSEPAALIERAKRILSEDTGAPAEAFEFLGLEPVDWPDASLGCPRPGEGYAQAIVSGFRLRFSYGGEVYTLHTDSDGRVELCTPPAPEAGNLKGIEGTIRDGHPNEPIQAGTIVPKPIK